MKLTLKDINEAVSAKYEPLELELGDGTSVVLRPALRMKESERKALTELQASRTKAQATFEAAQKAYDAALEAGDSDAVAPVDGENLDGYLKELIALAVGNAERSDKLFAEVGDDLAFLIEIVTSYSKSTQPGEASTSES